MSKYFVRFIDTFLVLLLIVTLCFHSGNMALCVSAAKDTSAKITETPVEKKILYVHGTVNIRKSYSTESKKLGEITTDYATPISFVVVDGVTWYKIKYEGITGYVHSEYVSIVNIVEPEGDFAAQLKTFPEEFREKLTVLHSMYPNWSFIADYVELDFSEAVYGQTLDHRKLVSMSDAKSWRALRENYNWETGNWYTYSGNWTDASKEVIAYYMDPRNFLSVSDIFMFARHSFNFEDIPNEELKKIEEGLTEFVKGTYLAKKYNDPKDTKYDGSYIKVILEAAKQSGVNPYVLASTLILEQGANGNSPLISGESGYYNFFNFNATGSDVVGNGIKYAKEQGWTTRSLSIIGGAIKYAKGYIMAGQDTYYYKDFDVLDASPFTHQYAQSIYDARVSSVKLRAQYIDKADSYLTFRIPIYKNMPSAPQSQPKATSKLNNYYFTDISVSGLSPKFSKYTQSYELSVTKNTTIKVSLPKTAMYAGEKEFALKKGINEIVLYVKSETEYYNDYKIKVAASKACKITIDTGDALVTSKPNQSVESSNVSSNQSNASSSSEESSSSSKPQSSTSSKPSSSNTSSKPVTIKKGDANGDKKVDIIDLAAIRLDILGLRKLKGNDKLGGDANGDGKVDIIDLAAVRMAILGIIKL